MTACLRIVPVAKDQVDAFITAWHRHHRPPQGYKFTLGVAADDVLVGVATVGRPVARGLDDGLTVEVTRVATDGTSHACSALYGACWRAAKAMGFARAVTYTQGDESGSSLRAAGWLHVATREARRGWDTPARRRLNDGYGSVSRLLWMVESSAAAGLPVRVSMPEGSAPELTLFELGAAS